MRRKLLTKERGRGEEEEGEPSKARGASSSCYRKLGRPRKDMGMMEDKGKVVERVGAKGGLRVL